MCLCTRVRLCIHSRESARAACHDVDDHRKSASFFGRFADSSQQHAEFHSLDPVAASSVDGWMDGWMDGTDGAVRCGAVKCVLLHRRRE